MSRQADNALAVSCMGLPKQIGKKIDRVIKNRSPSISMLRRIFGLRACGVRRASSSAQPRICVVANENNPALPSMPKSLADFVVVTEPSHFEQVAGATAVVHLPGSFGVRPVSLIGLSALEYLDDNGSAPP